MSTAAPARQVFAYPPVLNIEELSAKAGITRERRLFVIRNARLDPDWADTSARPSLSRSAPFVADPESGRRRSLSHLCDVAARRRRFQPGLHSPDLRRAAQLSRSTSTT